MRNSRIKVLVTAGAGFLGTNLAFKLLEIGNEIVCFDNLYTGSQRIVDLFSVNRNYRFIHHDATTPYFVEVDAIFNLVCPAAPIHYQRFPVETLKTKVLGTINALELAKKIDVSNLQASTSEIYGDPKISP